MNQIKNSYSYSIESYLKLSLLDIFLCIFPDLAVSFPVHAKCLATTGAGHLWTIILGGSGGLGRGQPPAQVAGQLWGVTGEKSESGEPDGVESGAGMKTVPKESW